MSERWTRIKDNLVGEKNGYVCSEGHTTITIHKDHGVTPMFLGCKTCGATANSQMYSVEIYDGYYGEGQATHEWYKPEGKVFKSLDIESQDHVTRGGLLLREIE